ncbi:MAG TPA: rod shape-determining protein MreD [Candidatus Kryptobacter bacterium]|nr:MAG: rod shape-determining protein MreD [Ignavibacteriae bacterium 37-53-5]HQT91330.1 rod shape-determining protein MreD [Candidatus Kryptobacter bacterium]
MTKRVLIYAAVGIGAIILQKFLDNFASIDMVSPQLIILFVVYLSLREGQLFGMGGGLLIGLLNDSLVTHFIGYTSFVGVMAGFVAGFFFKESDVELTARTFNFAWISAITLAVSELAALPIIASGELNYFYVFLKFTVGTTIYTSAFAMIIVFMNGRKSHYV